MFHALYDELKLWGWDGQKIASFATALVALCISAYNLWKQKDRYRAELLVLLPKRGKDSHTLVVINSGNKTFTVRKVYLRRREWWFTRLIHLYHGVWPIVTQSLYDLTRIEEPERLDIGAIKRIPLSINREDALEWTLHVELHSHKTFKVDIPKPLDAEELFERFLIDLVRERLPTLRHTFGGGRWGISRYLYFYRLTPWVSVVDKPYIWIRSQHYADLRLLNALSKNKRATNSHSSKSDVERMSAFAESLSEFLTIEAWDVEPICDGKPFSPMGGYRLVWTDEALRIADDPSVVHEWYAKLNIPRHSYEG